MQSSAPTAVGCSVVRTEQHCLRLAQVLIVKHMGRKSRRAGKRTVFVSLGIIS